MGGRDSDGHDSYESRYGEGSVAGRGSRIGRLDDEDDDDEAAENEKKPVRRSEQPQKSRRCVLIVRYIAEGGNCTHGR